MAMFISLLSSIFLHLLICPSVHQSIIYLSIYASTHQPICPPIHYLSTHLSIHLLCLLAGSSDVFTPVIIPITRLTERPILITTKYSPSDTTTTRSLPKPTAVVSSPGLGVTIINGTDADRYVFMAPGLYILYIFILVLKGCGDEDVGWVEQDQT